MKVIIVSGAQWGSEGKGKVVDFLASRMNSGLAVRTQGGPNADHVVMPKTDPWILYYLPSGCFNPKLTLVVGNGVVIDPKLLTQEIGLLSRAGIKLGPSRLFVSELAHVTLPRHRMLDRLLYERGIIGSTGTGVGPANIDRILRIGVRMEEFVKDASDPKKDLWAHRKSVLLRIYGNRVHDTRLLRRAYARNLRPFVTDISAITAKACQNGDPIILECSHGVLQDIDLGVYPFVSTSSCVAAGACSGAGIGPTRIDHVLGVLQAYTSRGGPGPFPTEAVADDGGFQISAVDRINSIRSGWLDLVAVRYGARVSGFDSIAVTKLDELSHRQKLKICIAYKCNGRKLEEFPTSPTVLSRCHPVYVEFSGWKCHVSRVKSFSKLPQEARAFLKFVEETVGVPISLISVGPRRDQTILVDPDVVPT